MQNNLETELNQLLDYMNERVDAETANLISIANQLKELPHQKTMVITTENGTTINAK